MLTMAVLISTLVVMFLKKNKYKRKEIVQKMSHAYANNHPILFVMENNGGADSPTTTNSSFGDVDFNNHHHHNHHHHPHHNPFPEQYRTCPSPMKSKLSLSFPQNIEQLHKNFNGTGYI